MTNVEILRSTGLVTLFGNIEHSYAGRLALKAMTVARTSERERCAELAESFDACDTKYIAAAIRALGDE